MTVEDWASIGFLYEAIILTSNLGFSRWGEVLGDQGSRLPLRKLANFRRMSPRLLGSRGSHVTAEPLSGATRRDPVQ
jgi:hypothetical protein